jgi:hypothetical protein
VPDTETIELIIDAAFWASLRREEGYVPRISLAFLSPEEAAQPLVFERPLRVDPGILTRVAPAVERARIHLGVWRDPTEGLYIWDAARQLGGTRHLKEKRWWKRATKLTRCSQF